MQATTPIPLCYSCEYAIFILQLSIKGHTNNSLQWKVEEVSSEFVCSRSFSNMRSFPHYTFCKHFFGSGEDKARKFEEYCKVGTESHRQCFNNLPSNLQSEPLWWVMPWGGILRQPCFDIEKQKEIKIHYTNRFIKLLKSVEKNKLIISRDMAPPVHKLCHQNTNSYILQDGHHRSAIHCFLKNNGMNELIKPDKNQKGNNLLLKPTIVIHRHHIIRSSYCSVGKYKNYFSLNDAYSWFDLPFKVLKLHFPLQDKITKKLVSIHEKAKAISVINL